MNYEQIKAIEWLHKQKDPNIWISYLILTDKNPDVNSPKLSEKDSICLFDILIEKRLIKQEQPNKFLINKYANWVDYIFELKCPVMFYLMTNWLNISSLMMSILAIIISIYALFK